MWIVTSAGPHRYHVYDPTENVSCPVSFVRKALAERAAKLLDENDADERGEQELALGRMLRRQQP